MIDALLPCAILLIILLLLYTLPYLRQDAALDAEAAYSRAPSRRQILRDA